MYFHPLSRRGSEPSSPTSLLPRSSTMSTSLSSQVPLMTWIFFRTLFIVFACFWIGYLTAVVGPRLHAHQTASIRHRVGRFANYLSLSGKILDSARSPLPADDILQRSISSPVSGEDEDYISKHFRHILIPLTSVNAMPYHKTRFEVCMESILEKSSVPLHFFFVVDAESKLYLQSAMLIFVRKYRSRIEVRYDFLDQETVAKQLAPSVSMVQQTVSGNTKGYYNQSIFFLSVGVHKDILPSFVHQIIMLDTDLKFLSDIKDLFDHFDRFTDDNVMGIAYDQQPTYRDAFKQYRARNPLTRVGSPPPKGLPGFNSGVVLLDIDRMRSSELYNLFLNPLVARATSQKYSFKGNLGDQDFYSLIGNERENLFYVLPCSWNRHLCRKLYDSYSAVFDSYFRCDGKIHVYHASCNSTMPV